MQIHSVLVGEVLQRLSDLGIVYKSKAKAVEYACNMFLFKTADTPDTRSRLESLARSFQGDDIPETDSTEGDSTPSMLRSNDPNVFVCTDPAIKLAILEKSPIQTNSWQVALHATLQQQTTEGK